MTNKFPALPKETPPGQTFDRPSVPAPMETPTATGNHQVGGTRLADRDSEPAKGVSAQGPAAAPDGQDVPPTSQPVDPDKTGFFTDKSDKKPEG